jgi:predicted TIM-barrel fold metal-dependent hydrolase
MTFTRRDAAAMAALGLMAPGCAHLPLPSGKQSRPPGALGPVIDAHCHLFNESDLPVVRFLKIVFLGLHQPDEAKLLDLHNGDVLDGLIYLFKILFAGKGPTARAELADLTEKKFELAPASADPTDAAVQQELADWLRTEIDPTGREPGEVRGEAAVRAAIIAAGGAGKSSTSLKLDSAQAAQATASAALASSFDIGVYLRWFKEFRRSRARLTDKLIAAHREQGAIPRLMTPAMVDYTCWLGETPRSPFADQVDVFTAIARRPGETAVHGYVAYDPLHQVFTDMQRKPKDVSTAAWAVDQRESPLDRVRRALTSGGFLGVKLYPPMGFRAGSNAAAPRLTFPDPVNRALGGISDDELAVRLDDALDRLYRLCTEAEIDAPIMAHGGEGNQAGDDYGSRADPYYWLDVIRRFPTLRVSVAHFGHFAYRTAMPDTGLPGVLANTFEGAFAHHVVRDPTAPFFADLAYYEEVLNASRATRGKFADHLKFYRDKADPRLEHLLFGTDWVMLGNLPKAETYTGQIHDFLSKDCGFGEEALANIMWRNAVRFAGLGAGAGSRRRLERFYAAHGLDQARLRAFDA